MAKPDASVDLLLHLPKVSLYLLSRSFEINVVCLTIDWCLQECFHEKDYMNHLYHAKRCLYLCVLKNHLLLSSSVEKVEWSALQNEARKPVLVVFPGMCALVFFFAKKGENVLTPRMRMCLQLRKLITYLDFP